MIPSLAGQSTIGAADVNMARGREDKGLFAAVRVSSGQLPIHADLSSRLFFCTLLCASICMEKNERAQGKGK